MQLRLLTEFPDVPLKIVLPLLLVAFAAALLFALWTYRRAWRVVQPGWYYTFVTLRCLAVLVLFLCVLAVLVAPEAPRRGRVAVFLDNTGSMARTNDSIGSRARLDAAASSCSARATSSTACVTVSTSTCMLSANRRRRSRAPRTWASRRT